MSEAKHAPGPWRSVGLAIVCASGHVIAYLKRRGTLKATKANAYLIAAAPDMLAALERIAEHTNPDSPEENYRADDREGCLDTVFEIARAAIAKAKGE